MPESLSEFEKHGYFEVSSLGVREHILNEFGSSITFFRKLNEVTWSLQTVADIPKDNTTMLFAFPLYSKTINFIQAAFMLSSIGLKSQGETQLRCSLEPLFRLCAMKEDEDFITIYALAEEKDHLKQGYSLLSYMERQKPKNKSKIKRHKNNCEQKKASLIEKLKIHKPELFINNSDKEALDKFRLPTGEIAKKAGLEDWYDIIYRSGSADVHSDAKSLEDHFVMDEQQEIQCLKNEPDFSEFELFIFAISGVLFKAVESYCHLLKVDLPEEKLNALHEEFLELEKRV